MNASAANSRTDGRAVAARADAPVADDPQRLDLQRGVVLAEADGDDARVMGHDARA